MTSAPAAARCVLVGCGARRLSRCPGVSPRGPGISFGPVAASPLMKIASWRAAISGQSGPCGSGWVMSALKTMMSVALVGVRMLRSAWPRSMKRSRRRLISCRACTALALTSGGAPCNGRISWSPIARERDRNSLTASSPDRILAVNVVEDLVEQAVGAVLESVEQGLAVGVAPVERPDADSGLGRDRGERDVAAAPQHCRDRRSQDALAVQLGVAPGTPACLRAGGRSACLDPRELPGLVGCAGAPAPGPGCSAFGTWP